jgi:hypothetical protein
MLIRRSGSQLPETLVLSSPHQEPAMRLPALLSLSLACLGLMFTSSARAADKPASQKARILMVTDSKGFRHGSVTRKEKEHLSPAEIAATQIGQESGLFTVDCTQDAAKDFTRENLKNYDIVWFYTTGNLGIAEKDLDYFFNDWLKQKGHGFIGTHSASDTYNNYEPYWDMI